VRWSSPGRPGPALAALLLTTAWLAGCTALRDVFGFEKQLEKKAQIARITGRIETEGPARGNLVVILGRPAETPGAQPIGVDSFLRERPGPYFFAVAPGRYLAGAYEDANRNGLVDPGERVRRVVKSRVIEVGPGETQTEPIRLEKGSEIRDIPGPVDVLGLVARTPKDQRHFSLWAWSAQGELCEDLDDPAFGPEAGPKGLWQIMDFLAEGRAGIYFLEPYDPDRVPVLFVHGIAGFPQQFEALIDSLDRKRFQPWFYFYPSGFPLDGISTHLATLLERLQVEHGFDELAIVAHSMGGLVSRGAILKYHASTGRDDVRLFVTLSTPWGGDVKAEKAGEAPIELPESFSDMNPSSDYLRWIFYQDEGREVTRELPDGVEFHMLFGYRMPGDSSAANDGSVTVASEARLEAQEQAVTVRALDYGHVPILKSPEALARVNLLLDRRF
jgi:pimeloyl-ACP methyl ester carboxylesterase